MRCSYYESDWPVVDRLYFCSMWIEPKILTPEAAEISGISGEHEQRWRTNDDVTGFYSGNRKLHYFPRGLEKFFKNLNAIYIGTSGLKEIHQADLKSLTNLIYLSLSNNEIEVIEEGLFDFNFDLIFISQLQNGDLDSLSNVIL